MRKICAFSLAAVVLTAPVTRAETLVIRVGWEEAQTMLARDDFFRKIRVELQSDERLTGKLVGTSGAGLQLKQRKGETTIARGDIRTIRFVYRKAVRKKNRILAVAAGAGAGFAGGFLAYFACCFRDDSGADHSVGDSVFYGVWAAIQFGFYRLGLRADRRAVLLELTETAADSAPPAPTQAEEPPAAKKKPRQQRAKTGGSSP